VKHKRTTKSTGSRKTAHSRQQLKIPVQKKGLSWVPEGASNAGPGKCTASRIPIGAQRKKGLAEKPEAGLKLSGADEEQTSTRGMSKTGRVGGGG